MFFLFFILLPTFAFAVLYLVGRIPPLDQVIMFLCGLLSIPLKDSADLLAGFKEKQLESRDKHPGLKTIILTIFLSFALIATVAEAYNALDAISALFGDASVNLPTLPAIFSYSMGLLYISLSVLFGGLYAEKYIPLEARVFAFQEEEKEKQFTTFVSTSFWLSVVATIAFFAARWGLLNDSPLTPFFQFVAYVLLGVLMPLLGFVSIYLIACGLQVILSLAFTLIWFVASVSSHCLEYIGIHYKELALVREKERAAKNIATTVEAIPESEETQQITTSPAAPALPSPAPFAGRKREDFPLSGSPAFVETVNRILDEVAEKVPHRYQELLQNLPQIAYDPSLNHGNSWYALSDGRFGFTEDDYERLRWVILHESGHCVLGHTRPNAKSKEQVEQEANEYAHKVTAEIEAYQKGEVA